MDAIAIEKLVSSIVAETVKSMMPAILASLENGKPGQNATFTGTKKAARLEKLASSDTEAFDIVKGYVLARKAGKIERGPFLTCYRHITEVSTLDDVKKSSPTALETLRKEARKVLNYQA